MAKAIFKRKAIDIDELKAKSDLIRIGYDYVIEKVVELEQVEYDDFAADLMANRDFIEANLKLMYTDTNNVWHCILVMVSGRNDGILVESEGYTYARYSAYLDEVIKIEDKPNG